MPKITNTQVIEILRNPYFIQHTSMHLSRERLTLPDGTKLPLILPPCLCDDCKDDGKMADPAKSAAMPVAARVATPAPMGQMGNDAAPAPMAKMDNSGAMSMADDPNGMIEAGLPGSGRQLLEMHHEMIRVFRFLMENNDPPLQVLAEWRGGWYEAPDADNSGYAPQIWDLDDPGDLPHEILGTFQVTDPKYLGLVFAGVKKLIEPNAKAIDDAVDDLGRFIEQGVKSGEPDGSGFHNTMHEFLAAREGRSAQGAEMNKLNNSRFNDYFWSMHLWIDSQYGRLLEKRDQKFDTSGLDPKTLDMCTSDTKAAKVQSMSMSMTP